MLEKSDFLTYFLRPCTVAEISKIKSEDIDADNFYMLDPHLPPRTKFYIILNFFDYDKL